MEASKSSRTEQAQGFGHNPEAEVRSLALLPEQDPNPVLRALPNGGVLYANAAARSCLKALGVADSASLPSAMLALVKEASGSTDVIEEELGNGEGQSFLFSVIRPPGQPYVNLYGKEVTARKLAEEALSESESRYRMLHETLRDPFAQVSMDGRIIEFNSRFCEMLGYSPEEVRSLKYQQITPERWHEFEQRIVNEQILPRGYSDVYEKEYRRKDGSIFPVELRTILARDRQGRPRSMWALVRDIGERRREEERLRQSQKFESLGLLAGGVAHDFNNLLVGIIGSASLAQEMLPSNHPAADLLSMIVKTGDQAAHLTRQMLAYSGKGKFLVDLLDLSAVARDILELARPALPRHIVLGMDLDGNLPPIEADRGQVQQILMNLTMNAAEAIGNHKGSITVRTGTQVVDSLYEQQHPEAADLTQGEYVALEVCDTGCGMDSAIKDRIFDPFFTTKFTGRGLGLAAVAGIVRGHHGAVTVTTAPGRGSSFTVLFPKAPGPLLGADQNTPKPDVRCTGVVLVIDDEDVVRQTARLALEHKGYTVLLADGGPSAIDILKRHHGAIDLAVLDLSMPGMSGEELLPELRRLRPDIRVFVSSGYSEAEAITLFHGQRVSGFLQKPYSSATLAQKVDELLGSGAET